MTGHFFDVQDRAGQLFRARRLRDDVFEADRDGFGEPAWDILLGLMSHDRPVKVDEVLQWLPAVPASTADTYLRWLASRDLVTIVDHVMLTDRARETMTRYLQQADTSINWVHERRAKWGDDASS